MDLITIIYIVLSMIPLSNETVLNLGSDDLTDRFRALKFASSTRSYLNFVPSEDFSLLKYRATVCAWLRAPGSSRYPTVFTYNGDNFRFTGKGSYNSIRSSSSYFPTSIATSALVPYWHFSCLTFGASSSQARYYVNGNLIASKTVSGLTIAYSSSYKVTIGNLSPGSSSYYYGGSVVGLNVYAKELTSTEIIELYSKGLCSLERDPHEDWKVLGWGEILKQTRTGTVSEFTPTNCTHTNELVKELGQLRQQVRNLNETRSELRNTTAQCAETKAALNTTKERLSEAEAKLESCSNDTRSGGQPQQWDWNVFSHERYINKTITQNMTRILTSSWSGLAEKMIGLQISDRLIEFLKIVDECSNTREWETLRSSAFYNKIMTKKMAAHLLNMWDNVSERLVGITMTPRIIELLNYIQETQLGCDTLA